MLFRYQWALIFVLFCSLSFAESITLQTYYPAPQGNYRSMRSGRICVGSNCQKDADEAQEGSIFVQKGVQLGTVEGDCNAENLGRIIYSSVERDVMVCTSDGGDAYFWSLIGSSQPLGIWMGGATAIYPRVSYRHYDADKYYNSSYLYNITTGSRAFELTPKSGSLAVVKCREGTVSFELPSSYVNSRQGKYRVVYGGGYLEFLSGVEVAVTLKACKGHTGVCQPVDSFIIRNPIGVEGFAAVVPFPQRSVDLGSSIGTLQLTITPCKSVIDSATIIGHAQYGDGNSWGQAGGPIVDCSLTLLMKQSLCSSPNDQRKDFLAYKRSYDNVTSALSITIGHFHTPGFAIDVYQWR